MCVVLHCHVQAELIELSSFLNHRIVVLRSTKLLHFHVNAL